MNKSIFKNSKKRGYIIGTIIVWSFGLLFIPSLLLQFETFNKGKLVTIEIDLLIEENNFGLGSSHIMKFTYNNSTYSREISPGNYERLMNKSETEMKFNESSKIFLFPRENPIRKIFIIIIPLFLWGLYYFIRAVVIN